MKQHISVKDLGSLTEEQLNKLTKYFSTSECLGCMAHGVSTKEIMAQKTTIGKMIEILYSNYCDLYIQAIGCGWEVEYMCRYYVVETPELVDALWEAVKSTL